jgi:hypothetical protein
VLVRSVDHVYVAKGAKVVHHAVASADPDAVLADILGRSGTLRAPTARRGRTLLVGYNPELYAAYL